MKNHFIETKRLLIRPYQKSDYMTWLKGYQDRLPATYKYDAGHDGKHFTERWFSKWVDDFTREAQQDRVYLFGVFRKEDGAHIGEIEVLTIYREGYDWAMMGYSIHNQYHRLGYGRESVQGILPLCFYDLRFNRIELHINIDNEPSIAFAEGIGFIYECTRPQFFYEGGKWIDQMIFVKTKDRLS